MVVEKPTHRMPTGQFYLLSLNNPSKDLSYFFLFSTEMYNDYLHSFRNETVYRKHILQSQIIRDLIWQGSNNADHKWHTAKFCSLLFIFLQLVFLPCGKKLEETG